MFIIRILIPFYVFTNKSLSIYLCKMLPLIMNSESFLSQHTARLRSTLKMERDPVLGSEGGEMMSHFRKLILLMKMFLAVLVGVTADIKVYFD